jgi:hypothetical protein
VSVTEPVKWETPATLDDALRILEDNLKQEDKDHFKTHSERECLAIFHSTLGRYLRNEWDLWHHDLTKSPMPKIVEHFLQLGLNHADDMSGVIITSYWRKLHNQPLNVEGQVERSTHHWHPDNFPVRVPRPKY